MWAWMRSLSVVRHSVFIAVLQKWSRPLATMAVACAWLVFYGCCSSRCVPSVGRQAQDARHLGRYETRWTVISGLCLDRIAGDDAFALCSLLLLSAGPCCQASCTSWTILFVARLCNDRFPGPDSCRRWCSSWTNCSRPSLCNDRCRVGPDSVQ